MKHSRKCSLFFLNEFPVENGGLVSRRESCLVSRRECWKKKLKILKTYLFVDSRKKKLLKEQLSQTQHSSRCHLRQNNKCFFWKKQFFQIKIPGKDYITDDNIINVFRENATTLLTYCSDI